MVAHENGLFGNRRRLMRWLVLGVGTREDWEILHYAQIFGELDGNIWWLILRIIEGFYSDRHETSTSRGSHLTTL